MRIIALLLLTATLFTASAQDHELIFPDLTGQELLDAVTENFTPASVLSYDVARDVLFGTIDKRNDSLYGVYTQWPVYLPPGEDPTQAAFQNGQGLNTEHAWPQTFGADVEPARADMHHLFPTRVDVNQDRGNLPFGEIPDAATDRWYFLNIQTGNVPSSNRDAYSEYRQNDAFEPREDFKGNVARALMYFYTIYRDEADADGPGFFSEQRATLCLWHEQDPVDETEFARTLAIAEHQDGKPNPFVIDCTLPMRLYCQEVASNSCVVSTDDRGYLPLNAVFFPNPAGTRRPGRLRLTTESGGRLRLRWHDPLGRVISGGEYTIPGGEVTVDALPPGPGYWYVEMLLRKGTDWYRGRVPVVVTP